jgi:LPS-assembly lipoprotein
MSWLERRRLLLILPAAALVACGFQPVYAPGGTGGSLRGRVLVQAPDDEYTYLLTRDLEDRLGRSATADYRLDYTLITATEGQAINVNNETTRYSIVGQADYVLIRVADGQTVASGNVRNFSGYSATGSTVQTLAGERDARKRLMTILADQIVTRLYATADLSE